MRCVRRMAAAAVGLAVLAAAALAPTAASAAVSDPLFGATIWQGYKQSYADAWERSNTTYGGLEVTRVFYRGRPDPWPGKTAVGGGPVIVSFKMPPAEVLAGLHDTYLRDWFAGAPTDRPIWWSYFHEPEDNIQRGQITAAEFRAAFAHIDALAESALKANLHSTLILMCWTLEPNSGRNWLNYYPGDLSVDALGWDCYNYGHHVGRYKPMSEFLWRVPQAAASVGKPWGVAELGSVLISGDDGTNRAQWLREGAAWMRGHANPPIWAAYFDKKLSVDYRLMDAPSQTAWRDITTGP